MPYISIESGRLTAEQKKELIERLTATASEILCRAKRFACSHIPEQLFTVTIKELLDENFGIHKKRAIFVWEKLGTASRWNSTKGL